MFATVFGLLLISPQIEKAPRLKSTLPNGAMALVQQVSSAKQVTASLILLIADAPESPETHGRRHLLEHLLAKGKSLDLDKRLEAKGAFLTASTTRDAMTITIQAAPDDLPLALTGLQEMLQSPKFTKEQIASESKILAQELALTEPEAAMSAQAWAIAFGNEGSDALGSLDAMAATTPEELLAVYHQTFQAGRLMVVISGPIDVDQAMASAKAIVATLPAGGGAPSDGVRKSGKSGEGSSDKGFGETRGALEGGLNDPQILGTLAAGMALASTHPDWKLVFTPSIVPGLVLLRSSIKGEMSGAIDLITDEELYRHWEIGKSLLPFWLQSLESDGLLRGLLLRQQANLTPEKLLDQARALDFETFKKGMDAFRRGKAVMVVGR